jgi:hypothetical protein
MVEAVRQNHSGKEMLSQLAGFNSSHSLIPVSEALLFRNGVVSMALSIRN